jgi:hypothetical protein
MTSPAVIIAASFIRSMSSLITGLASRHTQAEAVAVPELFEVVVASALLGREPFDRPLLFAALGFTADH